jgi:hypothetical protein
MSRCLLGIWLADCRSRAGKRPAQPASGLLRVMGARDIPVTPEGNNWCFESETRTAPSILGSGLPKSRRSCFPPRFADCDQRVALFPCRPGISNGSMRTGTYRTQALPRCLQCFRGAVGGGPARSCPPGGTDRETYTWGKEVFVPARGRTTGRGAEAAEDALRTRLGRNSGQPPKHPT